MSDIKSGPSSIQAGRHYTVLPAPVTIVSEPKLPSAFTDPLKIGGQLTFGPPFVWKLSNRVLFS